MNVIDLSAQLNTLKNKFNAKHSAVGSYKGYDKAYAEGKIKEDHNDINEALMRELVSIKDYVPGLRNMLKMKREKNKFPSTSDREAQISAAYIFLNGKPDTSRIVRALDQALSVSRLSFASILFDHVKDNAKTYNGKDDAANLSLISKAELIHSELAGLADIDEDLIEVDKIEGRIKNFETVMNGNKFYFMFFPDQKMTDYEIQRAEEFIKDHGLEIPVEEQINMKHTMFNANNGYQVYKEA